jgi:hypothetical protein
LGKNDRSHIVTLHTSKKTKNIGSRHRKGNTNSVEAEVLSELHSIITATNEWHETEKRILSEEWWVGAVRYSGVVRCGMYKGEIAVRLFFHATHKTEPA